MKAKRTLALVLCMVLLVAGSVLGTLAYLTSTTGVVENTFTVGKVEITLDEAKVNADGTAVEGADRVTENKYHLIPGHSYIKDPTVHVDDESENCWLFVKVENGLADIIDTTTIEAQMDENDWDVIDADNGIYAYERIATKADTNVVVFENFKLKGDADVAKYADAKITVTAYAVQADGFTTAAAAWAAAPATW